MFKKNVSIKIKQSRDNIDKKNKSIVFNLAINLDFQNKLSSIIKYND